MLLVVEPSPDTQSQAIAGKRDEQGRHLQDAEEHHEQGQYARRRNACENESHAEQDGLDEGDADDAGRNGAHRRGREFLQPGTPHRVGQPAEDALASRGCRIPRRPA